MTNWCFNRGRLVSFSSLLDTVCSEIYIEVRGILFCLRKARRAAVGPVAAESREAGASDGAFTEPDRDFFPPHCQLFYFFLFRTSDGYICTLPLYARKGRLNDH